VFRGAGRFKFDHLIRTDGTQLSLQLREDNKDEEKKRKRKDNNSGNKKKKRKKKQKQKQKNDTNTDADANDDDDDDDDDDEYGDSKDLLKTKFSKRTVVGVDPGKHSIVYLTTDKGDGIPDKFTRLEYTTRQRRFETLQEQHQRQLEKLKRKNPQISESEKELSKTSSKAASRGSFEEYLKARWKVEGSLRQFYCCKWKGSLASMRRYQATQRSQTRLAKNIERTFGPRDQIVLAYGNWSRKTQIRGLPPSPVVGIKRFLAKSFDVVTVDEFRTTMTCCKCGMREMARVPERDIKYLKDEVEMKKDNRALRRCPNVDCGVLFSRDYNAAINIARQGRHLQEHGEPDPWFRRPKKNEQSSPNAGRASTSSRGCA
jgi:hypothetical protein